jgi:hypothetical protein
MRPREEYTRKLQTKEEGKRKEGASSEANYLNRQATTERGNYLNNIQQRGKGTPLQLYPGQTPNDRLDLVSCVFQLKKKGTSECHIETFETRIHTPHS